jgi:hypothetical protein
MEQWSNQEIERWSSGVLEERGKQPKILCFDLPTLQYSNTPLLQERLG